MKDKSRFLSSVIVSLLAGFIYYLLGQNINENVVSSVKAVLSSDFSEEYLSSDLITQNNEIKKFGNNNVRKNISFKKKNSFVLREVKISLPDENIFSVIKIDAQAKIQKPSPDRNVDFTSELNRLISKNKTENNYRPGKENRINKSLSRNVTETADINSGNQSSNMLKKNIDKSETKYYEKEYKGNGFEYNYVISSVAKEPNKKKIIRSIKPNDSVKNKKDCTGYQYKYDLKTEDTKENKFKGKIILPKDKINKTDEEDVNSVREINADDYSSEDSM